MLKIKILLSLICLFIFKTSIVEANNTSLSENRARERSNTLSPHENQCGDTLTNSTQNPDSRNRLPRQGIANTRYIPSFNNDSLLERIRLIESESQQDLERQGYMPEYIAGFDHVKTSLQTGYSIRQRFSDFKNPLDPKKTHIPEFARLINPHIDFIEKGIHLQDFPDKNERLSYLESLRSEVRSLQENKQMTYRRWLALSIHLSILASPRENLITNNNPVLRSDIQITPDMSYEEIFYKVENMLDRFLNRSRYQFPQIIMMPTIENSGYLGMMPFNRTSGTGVHLIGLSNNPMSVHQEELSPFEFLYHDMRHAEIAQMDASPFVDFLIYKITNLPKPQRERVEFVFFELTHEISLQLSQVAVTQPIQSLLKTYINILPATDHTTFFQIMPAGYDHTYSDVNNFLQQARDDFTRVFSEAMSEFSSLFHYRSTF